MSGLSGNNRMSVTVQVDFRLKKVQQVGKEYP